jgi:thiamine-phosphate pyrophosphorylase
MTLFGSDLPLRQRLSLIVIADPSAALHRPLPEVVRAALQAGAPAIQLRAKGLSAREIVELGKVIVQDTRRAGALFFVNDRVDIALVTGADGAHLGDDDLPLRAARAISPPGFLLGRSVDTPDEARVAMAEGADYVGVGPVFATRSKTGLGEPIGLKGVAAVAGACSLPVVGIGGIRSDNAAAVAEAGAAGVAVIQAVIGHPDPYHAVREILLRVTSAGNATT